MATRRRTQQERRDETRALVLEQALLLFGDKGYSRTSLQDIADACGLTIRPVYHYFGNKHELFQAVTETMEQQLLKKIEQSINHDGNHPATTTPPSGGWQAFLEMANDHRFRQIVLIDAPTVLGRERWATNPVVVAAGNILKGMQPDISEQKTELATRMVIAALAEGALILAESHNHPKTAQIIGEVLESLLQVVLQGGGNKKAGR